MADHRVHKADVRGAAVHALIIGVGRYPHLRGGGKRLVDASEGMGQLTSAPISARRFADWLLSSDGRHCPDRPVASVRLLLSEPKPTAYSHPTDKTSTKVAVANMKNVDAAVQAWLEDLDTSEDHLGMFFFAGHGVVAGLDQALLLADFGDVAGDPYRGAIRLDGLHLGMSRAAAREQCYFIDACRTQSAEFMATHQFGGRALVTANPRARFSRGRAAPIFNATLADESAYGLPGQPSLFTRALLDALKGAGGDNSDDEDIWRIETNSLNQAIEFLMRRTVTRLKLPVAQINAASSMSTVYLSTLKTPPLVPVQVDCIPTDLTALARFACEPLSPWSAAEGDPLLPIGEYTFKAEIPGSPPLVGSRTREIMPPYRVVSIRLQAAGG